MAPIRCNCPACQLLFEPEVPQTPPQLTLRERIFRQRQENHRRSDEAFAYVLANEARYAEHRRTILEQRTANINESGQHNDEMDTKWLTVPKGQLTFDAEGNDSEGSPFFSRKVHVPNNNNVVIGNSGVTIGRGLDLGNPPSGASGQAPSKLNLSLLFQDANLNPKLAEWLLSVKGKTKNDALIALRNSGLTEDELTITRKQQHLMFNRIYEYIENKTCILMTKADVQQVYGVVDWNGMPRKIKDVLIDITYRGDSTGSGTSSNTRSHYVPALVMDNGSNDYINFKEVMSVNNATWQSVPNNRKKRRYDLL